MISRTQHSSPERQTRSRAAQILANQPFLRGNLVLRYRSCGKSYCRCQRGQEHPALYLYTRSGGKQICTYIPQALHETVRQWVENGRRVKRLVDQVSQQNLQTLLERKRALSRRKAALGIGGPFAVMARFCAYVEKIFGLGSQLGTLTDTRTPSSHPHRRGLRQCLHPLRHPPRQPQRLGAGPTHPRAAARHRGSPGPQRRLHRPHL